MKNGIEEFPRPGSKPQQRVLAIDLARQLGVEPSTVRSWREKGMPVIVEDDGRETYSITDSVLWWATWKELFVSPAAANGGVDPNDKEALECEKLRIENARRELKLAKERGQVVERNAVKAEVEQLFHRVRSRLESVPDEMAASLPPEVRADYLGDAKHKVSLALMELESWGE